MLKTHTFIGKRRRKRQWKSEWHLHVRALRVDILKMEWSDPRVEKAYAQNDNKNIIQKYET